VTCLPWRNQRIGLLCNTIQGKWKFCCHMTFQHNAQHQHQGHWQKVSRHTWLTSETLNLNVIRDHLKWCEWVSNLVVPITDFGKASTYGSWSFLKAIESRFTELITCIVSIAIQNLRGSFVVHKECLLCLKVVYQITYMIYFNCSHCPLKNVRPFGCSLLASSVVSENSCIWSWVNARWHQLIES